VPKLKRNHMYAREPFSEFREDIKTLMRGANLEMPPQMNVLQERIENFRRLQNPCTVALVNAIVAGDDVDVLHAAALAEMAAPSDSRVRTDMKTIVATAAYNSVVDAYADTAPKHFATLAKAFNTAAAGFVKAAAVVDPEREATVMVAASDKERAAWRDAAEHADELDALLPCLVASARLNGIDIIDTSESISLVCDAAGFHRRRVHEAWELGGERCGRWSALYALGVPLRVADLNTWQPYAEPAPMINRTIKIDGRLVDEVIDPEDELTDEITETVDA